MNREPITRQKIDELLEFLPLFNTPGRQFVRRWIGGERTENGMITLPHPVYADDVLEFFRLASQPCWSDDAYEPGVASSMLEDDCFIEGATLEEIKTILTYCVRGERFCAGHWEVVLRMGKITAILERLAVLRESV